MTDVIIKLPCNIGDNVYHISNASIEYKVSSITIYANNNILITADNYEKDLSICFGVSCIGTRYFLSNIETELKAGK